MSKVQLSGNVSGTGVFTIASPNSNTDRTLTLPNQTGTILTNASTAGFPAGSVLQVVQAVTSTQVSTTSSSYVNTGFSASITPTSATSKILIMGSAIVRLPSDSSNYQHNIYRNNTTALAPVAFRGFIQCRGSGFDQTPSFQFLDSPATTSATTYNWWHKTEAGVTAYFAIDNSFAQLTLMEIAA